ncbi:MAG: SPOR domain-containing protein [Alphaproteobacteria bacterium]|nr:SPOR domain-containing protein [Alphaproteobacteria bacterium]
MRLFLLPVSIIFSIMLSACTPTGAPGVSGESTSKKATRSEILAATRTIELERRLNLPEVAIGDTYVFDNPITSWEVVDISNDRITWVSNQGARIITSDNPLLPSYEWISESDGQGKRLISDVKGDLFPLKKGNKTTFRSTVSIGGQPSQWSFSWNCAILGEVNVTVPAGNFNAFSIVCARDASDTITYYYAPELGYYVRMEIGGNRGSVLKQRNLLSYNNAAGASLQATQRLQIADDNRAQISDDNAPTLPLPLDDIEPTNLAQQNAQALLQRNQREQPKNSNILPIPGLLEEVAPSDNLSETPSANMPQLLEPNPSVILAPTPEKSISQPQPQPQPLDNETALLVQPPANILAGQTLAVHLASYRNRADAEKGWRILSNGNASELRGKNYAIQQVDLGNIGVFFRLYATPFDSLQIADNLCKRLRAKGLYCQVSEI